MLVLGVSLAFVIAGFVKGAVGIGLPTAALGLTTLYLDPRIAISLLLFPMITTNTWQMLAAGHLRRTAARYAIFAVVLVFGVGLTVLGTAQAGDRLLMGALGLVLLLFVWVTWAGWLPQLAPKWDGPAQVFFGGFGGLIGGLTASWAAPIAMYLTVRGTDKDEFIRATGFLITIGSIPMILGYVQIGVFDSQLATYSAALTIPAFIGLWLGGLLRQRLSGPGFRNAILFVFVALALNLLRRALF